MLGSNLGESYIVRKLGANYSADRLQAQSSLLLDIFNTGSKLIGLGSVQTGAGAQILKLLPLDTPSPCLLAIGNKLRIWVNYTQSDKEKLLHELDLSLAIKRDLQLAQAASRFQLRLVDACCMQLQQTDKIILLVLSISASLEQEQEGEEACGCLWLHTIELTKVQTPTTARTPETAMLHILHRLSIAPDVSLQYLNPLPTACTPHVHSMPRTWRVFVTYVTRTQRLHVIHLDILNQAVDMHKGSLQCGGGVDTLIEADRVLAMQVVRHVDGVCIVTTATAATGEQEQLSTLVICPPLCRDLVQGPQQLLRQRLDGLYAMLDQKQLHTLLWSLCHGQVSIEEVLSDLRNAVISFSPADLQRSILQLSNQLLALGPDGQIWGSSSRSTSNQVERMQLASELIKDKCGRHQRLLQALQAADAWHDHDLQQALLLNQQHLLLSSGLSAALQEACIRSTKMQAYVGEVYRDAIAHIAHVDQQEMLAHGLTAVELFYTHTAWVLDTLHAFPQVLSMYPGDIQVCYATLAVLCSALEKCAGEGLSRGSAYAIVTQSKVSHVLQ